MSDFSTMTVSSYLESSLLSVQARAFWEFRWRIDLFHLFKKQWKRTEAKQEGPDWSTWMIISQGIRQLELRYFLISNHYFAASLGSRVLAIGERRIWVLGWSIPLLEKVTCLYLFFCSRDYLQITNERNRVFGTYCGHKTGKTVLVSGEYALIKFHSNRGIQNEGFLISFTAVMPPCKKW